jgi:hypothetical protein
MMAIVAESGPPTEATSIFESCRILRCFPLRLPEPPPAIALYEALIVPSMSLTLAVEVMENIIIRP